MATMVTLPFGIKVEVSWETGSGIAVCIHFVSKLMPTAVSSGDLTAAITAFDSWRTAIRSVQPADIVIAGIRATDWSILDGATQLNVPSANVAGINGTPVLPLNVAMCVSHYTGRTGRSRRGRTYIPGLAENEVSVGDILTGSGRAAVLLAYANLRLALNGYGLAQVVASFRSGGAPRVTGLGTAVSTSTVDQFSDSQRRRLAGRGA